MLSKRSVVLILISVLIYGTATMALIYYLPQYLLDMGFERPVVQIITTIYPFSSIFLPQILGKFSDKIQNRYLFIALGAIGISLINLSLIFSKNLIFIMIFLILYSIFSVSYRLNFTLYQELTKNSPKFITYYNAISVFGWFLGSQLGGIFIDVYGVSQIFIFLLIISIFNILVISFIRENRKDIIEHYNNEENEKLKLNNLNEEDEKPSISKSIYIALFSRHFGVRPIITILAVLMALHLSSNTQIGFLLGFNPLLQFFIMLLTGKIISKKNEKYIFMLGFFLSSGAILGYMLATNFFGFFIAQIMVSVSYALFWNATQIYIAQKTNPSNKGKYMGYINSSFFSGGFLGGVFFSLLLSFNSDYYAFMWIMLIFPLISTLIISLKFKNQ
ncbi:MAG: MFS transporter [Candidatus Lokiarchaeota archaeon]|nr:MFS transporter [Candidatus Lokiarchaeota archaeon]